MPTLQKLNKKLEILRMRMFISIKIRKKNIKKKQLYKIEKVIKSKRPF
jgi:hypothetical protein